MSLLFIWAVFLSPHAPEVTAERPAVEKSATSIYITTSTRTDAFTDNRTLGDEGYEVLGSSETSTGDNGTHAVNKDLDELVLKVVKLWNTKFETKVGPWLASYARYCFEGYWDYVAYHNAQHAFDVYKFTVTIFSTVKKQKNAVKEVAVAALCHDFGHPGLANKVVGNGNLRTTLQGEEQKAVKAVIEASQSEAWWKDVGKGNSELGTYIAYAVGDEQLLKTPIVPGCDPACTSILEKYHAKKAIAMMGEAKAPKSVETNNVKQAILGTDFGRDYALRKLVASLGSKRPSEQEFQKIALHVADINGGSLAIGNALWWSAAVNAEFAHEALITNAPFYPGQTVRAFAASQAGWSTGVELLMRDSFKALGVNGKAGRVVLADIQGMIQKWDACAKLADKAKGSRKRLFNKKFDGAFKGKTPIQMRNIYISRIVKLCPDLKTNGLTPK